MEVTYSNANEETLEIINNSCKFCLWFHAMSVNGCQCLCHTGKYKYNAEKMEFEEIQ
jgi:hypothetical protein